MPRRWPRRRLLVLVYSNILVNGPSPFPYSEDNDNRTPPLTFRAYQILPHTNGYFYFLYSYPDLLPQGGPGVLQVGKVPPPPGTLGATGEGRDSCADSESSC
jgi:hypothetical protein